MVWSVFFGVYGISHASGTISPVKITRHYLDWNGATQKFEHPHQSVCVPNMSDDNYFQVWPWEVGYGPDGVQGAGEESLYLRYTVCDEVPADLVPAVTQAFQMYRDAGFAFEPDPVGICNNSILTTAPSGNGPAPAGFIYSIDPASRDRMLDELHEVFWVDSTTNPAYWYLGGKPGEPPLSAATVHATKAAHAPGTAEHFAGPTASWAVFINGVDVTYGVGQPSETW